MAEAGSGDLNVACGGGGPVGSLDVYVTAPRRSEDSEVAALHAYAGLVASLLVAAVTARVTGRLADQLQAAFEHRLLIEQVVEILVDREGLDAQAALAWLGAVARSSEYPLIQMARDVVGGAPMPSDRLPRPGRSGARPPTSRSPHIAGTQSCTRERPEATSGAVSPAEPRPNVCRRALPVARSSTPRQSDAAPIQNPRQPAAASWSTTASVQAVGRANRLMARNWAATSRWVSSGTVRR